MRADMKSPAYTTRVADVPVVRASQTRSRCPHSDPTQILAERLPCANAGRSRVGWRLREADARSGAGPLARETVGLLWNSVQRRHLETERQGLYLAPIHCLKQGRDTTEDLAFKVGELPPGGEEAEADPGFYRHPDRSPVELDNRSLHPCHRLKKCWLLRSQGRSAGPKARIATKSHGAAVPAPYFA